MDWTGLKLSLEEGALDGVVDELTEEAMNLMKFSESKDQNGLTRSTLPNFYVGAEMPFLNNTMSIGALYSARKSYNSMRNELTLSYNLNPVKWFALGVNYSFLNVTKTLGWILELTPKAGPCFHIGTDYMMMEEAVAPEGELRQQQCPADRVIRQITPRFLGEKDGRRIYDAGENITGWAAFAEKEKTGEKVTIGGWINETTTIR